MSLPSETCFPCKRLCRRGELIGLQWNCVDLDKGIMMIKQGLLYTKEKGVYVSPPKTGRPRAVCLAPETIEVLKKWKTEQLRTPDCPRSCRGKRCPCRCLLRFKRGITLTPPVRIFTFSPGALFCFLSDFVNRVAAVHRAMLPRMLHPHGSWGRQPQQALCAE